jgi:hypothetical protein
VKRESEAQARKEEKRGGSEKVSYSSFLPSWLCSGGYCEDSDGIKHMKSLNANEVDEKLNLRVRSSIGSKLLWRIRGGMTKY